MDISKLPQDQQNSELRKVLSLNHTLVTVLERAATLNLPNWYLAGGALSNTIWNFVSGFPPETGINDYDLVYFDPSDLSYEAEDIAVQAGKQLFADIPVDVEIRNQARVHLWYEKKHGVTCPPHTSVEGAIETWISSSSIIGVRLVQPYEWVVFAPHGLADLFNMVVKPNTVLGKKEAYDKKAERWSKIWKTLKIEPWPDQI